jgi:hypothetical protein
MLLGNLRRVVLIALVLLGIAGCTQRAERADIRIIGTKASGVHFEIGKVRSKLATDAVDETVRINRRLAPGGSVATGRRKASVLTAKLDGILT